MKTRITLQKTTQPDQILVEKILYNLDKTTILAERMKQFIKKRDWDVAFMIGKNLDEERWDFYRLLENLIPKPIIPSIEPPKPASQQVTHVNQ